MAVTTGPRNGFDDLAPLAWQQSAASGRHLARAFHSYPVLTWLFPEEHPAVRAGVAAATGALGRAPVVGKWGFSTNGIATAGMFGVPTIGYGPSNEVWAHTPDDQCPVSDLTTCARFYAAFPRCWLEATR